MTVPAVVALVTLGVTDVPASTDFYVSLGFPLSSASVPGEVSFFRTGGGLLGLYGADDLQQDATMNDLPPRPGTFRGVSLAINVADPAAVDAALATAEAVGARVVKSARATEWGGYHGYFPTPTGTSGRSRTTRAGRSAGTGRRSSRCDAPARRGRRCQWPESSRSVTPTTGAARHPSAGSRT